jgi:hypothetical protein
MTEELLEALCVLLAICIGFVVAGVVKLGRAQHELERERARYCEAATRLDEARYGEIAVYRQAAHTLTVKVAELTEKNGRLAGDLKFLADLENSILQ